MMTESEALEILGVGSGEGADGRAAAYERQRAKLEERIARAPAPGEHVVNAAGMAATGAVALLARVDVQIHIDARFGIVEGVAHGSVGETGKVFSILFLDIVEND